jgi:hypothetical protein
MHTIIEFKNIFIVYNNEFFSNPGVKISGVIHFSDPDYTCNKFLICQ